MHLHQVLTGAVNPGDNCYSVGSVEDVPFTAYGSGCDIVILANDFECVQIIPGAKHGNIQVSCVECSNQHGRVAASYGNAVCIFEPLGINSHKRNCQLKCQWLKTGQFFLSSVTYNLAWDPQDNRLLTATDSIQLWAPPGGDILEEEEEIDNKIPPVLNDWKCIWQCKTSVSVHLMEWSPDGEYFATAGKDDCLLKVWYPMTGWKSSIIPPDHHEVERRQASAQFSFVYLAHPRAVTGFSWRKTSKYMPRGSVCNVLLTSCHDGVCRLWAETVLPEDCLLGEQICETTTSSTASSLTHAGSHKDGVQHALETIHHLKNLRKGQRKSSILVTHTELMHDQMATHEVQRHISHHANVLCHFHIAASINPATDIPNVLVGTVFNIDDGNGGFVVHWLNNKEFHFTSSTEIFMQQLRKLSEKQVDHENDKGDREDECSQEERERGLHMKLDHELSLDRESEAGTGSSEHEDGEREGSPRTCSRPSVPMPLPTVLLDRKIEMLLTEWNKNPDMLFTIHPVDGTFLVWHVKYLDEYNPGIFRQVQVSFSSRIPVAFPSGDASSLSKNIMMYACINAAKDSHHTLLHEDMMAECSPHGSQLHSGPHSTNMNILAPTVMMVSKHIDGSLNQWAVTFADKSAFTTVLTVSHKFRYCGHRFHLNDLACHSVLPLLLTSSHHNALLTPESDFQWDSDNKLGRLMDPVRHIKGSSKQPLRNAATRTFHDPNAIYSELILWRVDPIGPLSYTGGVSELARINSLHTSAFSNVAWLPTLIPSYCLGTYCNSASACFVASDGKNLRLYQAVVDARKLLDELSDPESSKLIGEVFNIVSQQSTARPGCIIELNAITNQCGSNTQLLHVFQEDFIRGYKPHKEDMEKKETEIFFQPSQGYRPPPFSEKFFLVVIEKDSNNCSVLHMWHLHLKSVQACLAKAAEGVSSESLLSVPGQKNIDSSPETSPSVSPIPHSSSIANLQTASKLILSSRRVYSRPLDLPVGVEVIRATPSAGHLSSSSIYPVCLAPYLVVTTCSDNKVRFWKCSMETNLQCKSDEKETYHWRRWPLMNDEGEDNSSTVSIVGRPVAVSCSYTGRLAVAYKQPIHHNGFVSKEFSMHVCIFECESTGGSEWVLEQTIHLDDLVKVGSVLDSRVSVDSNLFVYSKSDALLSKDRYLIPNIKHLVHLDWVSKEDGSHILTVGVGANIFMYGRLSGIVTEQINSKDGVAVITLPLGGSIKQGVRSRWVLLRSIDLVSSVDGTPSLPVSLSWVRDGILVVGMDCEMHVYAQWKHAVKFGDVDADGPDAEETAVQDHFAFKSNMLSRKSIVEGAAIADDIFCSPTVAQDGGLFEAAHVLSPTLPQYHPTQLLELMDLGKVRRAKAILSHLVKCIAGEVAIVRDADAGEGTKRHLSRTISVSGSTAKDTVTIGKDGTRDYTEIDSIPPLPLYALLAADQDTTYRISEESTKIPQSYEDHMESQPEDQYSELFQIQDITTDDIDLEPEKRENKSKVINLSQYGPAYFGQEHARVLSSHLMHSSLPGLTRLEQMFLVALADTVATTSTELDENRDKSYSGRDTLDECGLRYLLAMRLHTCLLTSLPPLYRVQLLHQVNIIPCDCICLISIVIKSCNPVVFSFYNYLRTHPLLIRRNLASPEGTLATLGLKTEKNFVDKINLIERKLFFTTANAHFKVGCPVLALEVLSKIPKVTKVSALPSDKDQPDFISKKTDDVPSESKTLSDGDRSSGTDWSNVTSSQIDWSQPIVKVEEEPLTLDWGEEHDGALEEEEEDAVGLVMKSTDVREKDRQEDREAPDPNVLLTPQEEDCLEGDSEVDVIAEQLKFRACLKILMTELRTLATGYEVDGGKLRFQLYNWLEKEIAALHEICNHESVIKEYASKMYSTVESDILHQEEMVDKPGIGSYEWHQIERRRLQAKREHAERRKLWLQKNQDLLRVFLSYCSLHGAQGGGLASVRMELKFLLQESQQETTVKQLQSPLPLPTTLPLLSASIASTKTVIANPVLYLNNHIHDILYTIVQMKTPPHPSIEDVKVHTLHSLAASLSASIYQALCDSHSYSSQTEGNQFTGMAYQGLLLSDRRRLRTESIEEHATPNSSPAQWPGVSSLINLLSSAQDEDQPKLNILLCEAVVAVYLSLLIHALATNSSNELFRLAAHPLNNRMWAAVFGGGIKLVVKPQRQSENISAPPVPSEDIDKHRRRFNMRMLVPGRPVKDATPPPVPAERPSYKEKFIPPELSMWDYFVAKPFLPLSDSGVIYDSDESIHSDEEEDDAFFSDTQIQEHQDPNSYSWALLHLTMVKLVLHNVKNFFPIAGLEFSELPVTSPLGIAVIKNLENWEQILQEKMDEFEGPPPNYVNTYPTDLSVGAGPAILRNKAMLEPENTPFKSRDSSALPVKRLWHFLVKQEVLQQTFIRYIFTKKRKQSESIEEHVEQVKQNCIAEDCHIKVEADLGYPGGKAKIIHKESDMIMAFSVNKANCNEIVLASTHDVQELDITSLLACQSYIWIGEEYDRESKSSDDIDYRGSTTTLYQPSATSHSASQVHPSSSLPWLGSGQTSIGASVLMKRNLHNVKRMTSHPVHQYYLTGAQDGSVRMFEWTRPQQLVCFRQAGNARVTRLYFNSQGNKCGVADGEGFLSIWQVNQTASNPKPYMSWQCHSKATSDFAFVTSSSLVATSGQSNDNRNVCLWDTLISPGNSLIHGFTCHDHGATVLQYAPKQQLLISGGRKGYICIFDIRQRQLIHTFQAHDSAVKALALDPCEEYFTTGSAEGNIKVWRLRGHGLLHSFKNEHAKQSIFRNLGAGVMQIDITQGNRIFSCGADGTLKTRVLPSAFNIPHSILDIL
ncbi:dmX-like protein 2 [Sagmatias obliquidens]|uniref:dmX-like protein 2 n=1 Tax=Sagmatias obliquidens TaxID=3371155 RepID=UPI000F440CA1|nr:dmX-like protein 2 [Lagenorhynchus obliquidens]